MIAERAPRQLGGSSHTTPVQAATNHPDLSQHSLAAEDRSGPFPIHRPHVVTRPLPFFHPTRATFRHSAKEELVGGPRPSEPRWSSRASRKKRYSRWPIRVAHPHVHQGEEPRQEGPESKSRGFVLIEQRVWHSGSRLKVHLAWDLAFWIAVTFVLGSTVWIINGFFLFLPLVHIGSDNFTAASWSAFVGGTLFEIGSYLMYVEALNTGHEELFGPALWNLIGHASRTVPETPSPDTQSELGSAEKGQDSSKGLVKFRWIGLGSWRELGFLACFIQMWAATIFWVSTITGIPNVIQGLPENPPTAITDVFYWTPQVIGGSGFIIASLLLMIEVQKKWWLPNLRSMGWHIGFWNLVGAAGFTLCGALGYASLSSSKVNYQSVLSTFWGSWAFLIGSIIQLWEALWREDASQN